MIPRGLRVALSFFTVLPVAAPDRFDLREATPWLPAVGWIVGSALVVAMWVTGPLPAGLSAALVLTVWLAVTGMLHLDGLLDCADALLAPVSPERRLHILKDVAVGAFGFGVGALVLLLLWQSLAVGPSAWGLASVPVLGRFAVLFPMRDVPTARSSGLGASAAGGMSLILPAAWALPAVVIAPVPAAVAVLVVFLVSRWAAKQLGGGLTGDVYGALVVLAELAALIAVVVA